MTDTTNHDPEILHVVARIIAARPNPTPRSIDKAQEVLDYLRLKAAEDPGTIIREIADGAPTGMDAEAHLTYVRSLLAEIVDALLGCRTLVRDEATFLPAPCGECALCLLRAETGR